MNTATRKFMTVTSPFDIYHFLVFNPSLLSGFRRPFNVVVHTNDRESTTDGDALNRGFCLDFVQQPCSTTSGK